MSNVQEYLGKRRVEIGQRVKQIRRQKNWSQEDVANYLQCSRTRVNRAENGITEFTIGELELLSRQFDVSVLHFLGLSVSFSLQGSDEPIAVSLL